MREIKQTQIVAFLDHLSSTYDVFLPTQKGKNWAFEKFDPPVQSITLKPISTILPPKKFLLFTEKEIFNLKDPKKKEKISIQKPIALVGVNSFDIHALTILDQIMAGPHSDNHYLDKRKSTLIIGIGPERINISNSGYDLFLEESDDSYLTISGSSKGSELTKLKYFENSKNSPKKILTFRDPVLSRIDKIQSAIEKSWDSEIWQNLAKTCFGCGICSYVCPLCYCYEVEDNFSLDKCSACRTHRPDACFLPDFFTMGQHNLREKLSQRIYNWYYHKFVRMPREIGQIGCVDCGRCIEFCPAKINFKEVLKELIQ